MQSVIEQSLNRDMFENTDRADPDQTWTKVLLIHSRAERHHHGRSESDRTRTERFVNRDPLQRHSRLPSERSAREDEECSAALISAALPTLICADHGAPDLSSMPLPQHTRLLSMPLKRMQRPVKHARKHMQKLVSTPMETNASARAPTNTHARTHARTHNPYQPPHTDNAVG